MNMDLVRNTETIVSLVCGVGSVIMFLLSRKEKEACVRINNEINQKIEVINKNSVISSKDKIKIDKVTTFDNRKTIE